MQDLYTSHHHPGHARLPTVVAMALIRLCQPEAQWGGGAAYCRSHITLAFQDGKPVRVRWMRSERMAFVGSVPSTAMGSNGSFTSWKKLCEDGKLDEVLHALDHNKDARFSVLTDIFYCLLQGCIKTRNLEAGRRVYCRIVRNRLEANAYLGSHLICMFSACKSLLEANHVFKRLPKPNVFTWNEIILAHIKHGRAEQAIKLYNQMQFSTVKPDGHILVTVLKACASTKALKQGKLIHGHIIEFAADPDLFVWTTLIDMYAKCGCVKDAQRVFDRLRRRNVVTWSAMITGYVEHGHGEEALRLYKNMQVEGLDPDLVTLVSTLKACSSIAALKEGKLIHAQVIASGFVLDALLGNSLLDMYSKCGSHAEACSVFSILRKRDVVTWSAMIEAYAEHRDHVLALSYFGLMLQEGLRPDEAAFICLLSACSQLGLVEDGCQHFNSMAEKYGMFPRLDHFNCIVDLLGRAGCLIEAEDLLQTMPFQVNIVGWRSLLGHCRSHGNVELGKRCYSHVVWMDHKDASCYVIMSNIYAHANSGMDANKIEGLRRSARVRKMPGKATIMVHSKMHGFTVADGSYAWNSEIHDKLVRLTGQMKEMGYSPSLDLVLQPVFDEDNEIFEHT